MNGQAGESTAESKAADAIEAAAERIAKIAARIAADDSHHHNLTACIKSLLSLNK